MTDPTDPIPIMTKERTRIIQLYVCPFISKSSTSIVIITHLSNPVCKIYSHNFDNIGVKGELVTNSSGLITRSIIDYVKSRVDILLPIYNKKTVYIDIKFVGKYKNDTVVNKTIHVLNEHYQKLIEASLIKSSFRHINIREKSLKNPISQVVVNSTGTVPKINNVDFHKHVMLSQYNTWKRIKDSGVVKVSINDTHNNIIASINQAYSDINNKVRTRCCEDIVVVQNTQINQLQDQVIDLVSVREEQDCRIKQLELEVKKLKTKLKAGEK